MALQDYDSLLPAVEELWDTLKDSSYPEDELTETADTLVPIYFDDTVEKWKELPSQYKDSWREFGASEEATITQLMSMDLYTYYKDVLEQIYLDLKNSKQENEEDA